MQGRVDCKIKTQIVCNYWPTEFFIQSGNLKLIFITICSSCRKAIFPESLSFFFAFSHFFQFFRRSEIIFPFSLLLLFMALSLLILGCLLFFISSRAQEYHKTFGVKPKLNAAISAKRSPALFLILTPHIQLCWVANKVVEGFTGTVCGQSFWYRRVASSFKAIAKKAFYRNKKQYKNPELSIWWGPAIILPPKLMRLLRIDMFFQIIDLRICRLFVGHLS